MNKPKGIPISALIGSKGFERNYKLLMTGPGNPKVRDAVTAELVAQATKATKFPPGRTKGKGNKRIEAVRDHICALLKKHHKLASSPAQLRKRANADIVGKMADKTFADHVRAVRKK